MITNNIILQKPVITEKAISRTKGNCYTFLVDKSATKHQIGEAVQSVFGVTVTDVRTHMKEGKQRRVGKTRRLITSLSVKQAVVQLAKGQTIDIFTASVDEGETKA